LLALAGCTAPDDKAGGERAGSGEHAETIDAHDTQEPDGGDSGEADGDEGDEAPLPISLRVECPEDGLHFRVPTKDEYREHAPASLFINPEDVDYAGSEPVFAKIDVAASTLPWTPPQTAQGSAWTEIVEGGDALMFQSDFVASFTINVSLRAGDSETQTPWTCEMQWHSFNRIWLEVQSATGVTSDVQLHGLINQAEVDETDIYSAEDVTWCNTKWEGPNPEAATDDVHYEVARDRIGASMAVMYGPAVVDTSVDLVATAEDITQWDDEDTSLRPETELRVYSFDTLLHSERVRFDNNTTYHLGTITADSTATEEATFTPVQALIPSSPHSVCQD
jgi:hypothetical protein